MKYNFTFAPMIVYPSTVLTSTQVTDYINKIFNKILGRNPNETELRAWYIEIYQKKNINAFKTLQDNLYASDEYIQNTAGKGVVSVNAEPVVVVKSKTPLYVTIGTGLVWLWSMV